MGKYWEILGNNGEILGNIGKYWEIIENLLSQINGK